MSAGDTFLFVDHLWIVISDPVQEPERFLIVNFTSWNRRHDPACLVKAGEHPFVVQDTCVNYPRALEMYASQYEEFISRGLIRPYPHPLSPDLLERVRASSGGSQ